MFVIIAAAVSVVCCRDRWCQSVTELSTSESPICFPRTTTDSGYVNTWAALSFLLFRILVMALYSMSCGCKSGDCCGCVDCDVVMNSLCYANGKRHVKWWSCWPCLYACIGHVLCSEQLTDIVLQDTEMFLSINGGLQERHLNPHQVEFHSTGWRFE